MTGLTYGTWLIYDTVAPTSAWVVSDHAEGTEYIKFQNSPKRSWTTTFVDGVTDNPGGTSYAIGLGEQSESYTIDDIATEAQQTLIEKFMKRNHQPAYAANVYLVVCTADTPTVRNWYKNDTTPYAYLPVRLSAAAAKWNEEKQLYEIRIAVRACWP
jgi:hypothetical protein